MTESHPTIIIVGGVAGGASAATRARRMNEHARIILLEKDAYVSFANCGMPYYVGGEITDRKKLIVADADLLRRRFDIDVRTGHEVEAIDRKARTVTVRDHATGQTCTLAYDRLVLATGARPFVPAVEGANAPNVFTMRNLADTDAIKAFVTDQKPARAVVVGAGFIGLEMAEQLVGLGIHVEVVEARPQVLPLLDPEMAHAVQEALERKQVGLHLGAPLEGFRLGGGRVQAVRLAGGREIEADLVIMGIGVRPNADLAWDADLAPRGKAIPVDATTRTADPDVFAAGDATTSRHAVTGQVLPVALAGPANRAGRVAGQNAATDGSVETPAVLGTAILRVFDVTAGITGLSFEAAQRQGLQPSAVIVEANHHAGYFPGAQRMLLKLVFSKDDGRILGAQAVGGAGVDKRIDVVATAMHFRSSVRDLTALDLAYAPPFGSAKDPVHMVGFAATNELDGLVTFMQPDADLTGLQVLDVRMDAEVAGGMIGGAVHIPVDSLRARLKDLDATRPTVVVCRSGLRAWVASRILRQSGFRDVRVLTGGMVMRTHARPSVLEPA